MGHGSRLLGLVVAMAACGGCGNLPGKPAPDAVSVDPDHVLDFSSLYGQNCVGCHGTEGKGGPSIPLGDPVYLAIVDDDVLRKVISRGVHGTPMPAFAQSSGGMLTEEQIAAIVKGIRQHWAKTDALRGITPPSYAPLAGFAAGDASRGATVYATYCSSCHGPDGKGGPKGSSIVDGSFLALASDQGLRTIVIVGRSDLGAPDWRGNVPGRPMSPQDVSDVVAWLASQRPKFPGQPYPGDVGAKGGLP